MSETPHQRAEAELTAYGLTFPETTTGPAWDFTRGLYMRRKMFAVFGAKAQPLDALTLIVKLPITAVYGIGPTRARDILAELDTLKAWLRQSYTAIAPKKLSKLLEV